MTMKDDQDTGHKSMINNDNKTQLRVTLLAARKALQEDKRHVFDGEIAKRVVAWVMQLIKNKPDAVLGVYWPIRGEPDLRPAYAELSALGVSLALPVVVEKDFALRFLRWMPGEAMTLDRFGVAIPVSEEIVHSHALLIPCVGFNQERKRLGYGGGFYDRTLATAPRPQTVGIAYSSALAEFTCASHDIAMDVIFTESGEM